jgi:hypothetical protein
MTCETCFYSYDSYFQEPIAGRNKAGEEVWTDEVMMSSVICHADPQPKFVSIHCREGAGPDIYAEPEYHSCGRGRWWENGKWIRLIDAEDTHEADSD